MYLTCVCVCVCWLCVDKHQGKVLVSIEVLPAAVADRYVAGKGRKDPNMHPFLPPPTGRMSFVRVCVCCVL